MIDAEQCIPEKIPQPRISYKNLVQEYLQKNAGELPRFCTTQIFEKSNCMSIFVSKIVVDEKEYIGDYCGSKKEAESNVSKKVIEDLQKREKQRGVTLGHKSHNL